MKNGQAAGRFRRITGTALTVVLAASLMGACGANDRVTPQDPNYQDTTTGAGGTEDGTVRSQPDNAEQTPAGSVDAGNTGTGGGEAAANTEAGSTGSGSDSGATGRDMSHEGQGTFVGQQDPHTVEIETADGAVSYQIDDITAKQIADLAPNDKVSFKYREKELQTDDGTTKQLWLTEIKKAQ